jgi:hypothetical protein
MSTPSSGAGHTSDWMETASSHASLTYVLFSFVLCRNWHWTFHSMRNFLLHEGLALDQCDRGVLQRDKACSLNEEVPVWAELHLLSRPLCTRPSFSQRCRLASLVGRLPLGVGLRPSRLKWPRTTGRLVS